jgi:hypothetical protein
VYKTGTNTPVEGVLKMFLRNFFITKDIETKNFLKKKYLKICYFVETENYLGHRESRYAS